MGQHRRDKQGARLQDSSLVGADLDVPNIARMYDYFLGGAANLGVDRDAAEEFLQAMPGNPEWTTRYVQGNRSFLGRVVRELCQQGLDQFLDLGSGVPTVGNVHEIAHQCQPTARVAYIEVESVAVHHARQLLANDERISVTQADIRHPEQVLNAPGVVDLLDFTRPVAVLAFGIFDLIDDEDDPAGIIAAYRDACVPGSALAVSHAVQHAATDEQVASFQQAMHRTGGQLWFRTPADIVGYLTGYELLEPGLVPFDLWRPETHMSDEDAAQANGYGAVGPLPR